MTRKPIFHHKKVSKMEEKIKDWNSRMLEIRNEMEIETWGKRIGFGVNALVRAAEMSASNSAELLGLALEHIEEGKQNG